MPSKHPLQEKSQLESVALFIKSTPEYLIREKIAVHSGVALPRVRLLRQLRSRGGPRWRLPRPRWRGWTSCLGRLTRLAMKNQGLDQFCFDAHCCQKAYWVNCEAFASVVSTRYYQLVVIIHVSCKRTLYRHAEYCSFSFKMGLTLTYGSPIFSSSRVREQTSTLVHFVRFDLAFPKMDSSSLANTYQ